MDHKNGFNWRRWASALTVAALVLLGGISVQAAGPEKAGKVVVVTGRVLARNPDKGAQMRQLKVGDDVYRGEIINTGSSSSVKVLMGDRSIIDLSGSTLFSVDEYESKGKNVEDRKVQLSVDYGKIRASVNKKLSKKGKFKVRTRSATMGVRGTEFLVMSDLPGFEPEAPAGDAAGAGTGAGTAGDGAKAAKGAGGSRTEVVVVEGKVEVETPEPAEQVEETAESGGDAPKKPRVAKKVMLTAGQKVTAVREEDPAREPASDEGGASEPPARPKSTMQVQTLAAENIEQEKSKVMVEDRTFKNAIEIDKTNVGNENHTMDGLVAEMETPEMPDVFEPVAFEPDLIPAYDPGLVGRTVTIKVVFKK